MNKYQEKNLEKMHLTEKNWHASVKDANKVLGLNKKFPPPRLEPTPNIGMDWEPSVLPLRHGHLVT